jgi:hypothetical protein
MLRFFLHTLLLLAAARAAFGDGLPPVLFKDDLNKSPTGSKPAIPPWTFENSDANPDFEAVVRHDTTNIFRHGTTNHFLELRDSSTNGSLQVNAINVFSQEVVTLSFRFYEPYDAGYPDQLTVQLFAGTGTRANANRAQVLRLRNGVIPLSSGDIPFGYDQMRRIDFVVNNSSNTITYSGGYTLPSGLADVWLDGDLVSAGYSFAREAGPGPIRSVDFSTFSNHRQRVFLDDIAVFAGAVVSAPLDPPPPDQVVFPLRLRPGKEPSELFGYLPEYTQNVPSFDKRNRPYLRNRGSDLDATSFVHTIEDGQWVQRDFLGAVRAAYPKFQRIYRGAGWLTERVVFDEEDRAYMYLKIQLTDGSYRNIMLMSSDYCRTWSVRELNTGGDFAMEHDAGHNRPPGPPFLLLSRRQVADHPDPWASYHEFHVLQPGLQNGSITVPATKYMNTNLLSIGQHSGGSSFSVTLNGKTHFAWIEVTDAPVSGAPTYVATFNHASGVVGPPIRVAYAPPRNNSHNRPGMALDSQGYIHLVTGSHHGQNFYHSRTLKPNDAYSGWTTPEAVWGSGWRAVDGTDRGGQTYVSLVCDPEDTLHLAFRQWRYADQFFSTGSYYGGLSYQRKPKGGSWSVPRLLVAPEGDQYSIYYQKLAVDRIGRLFLSFSHFNWTMDEGNEARYQKRIVVMSDDRGHNWRLAATGDFATGWLFRTYEEWRDYHYTPKERTLPHISGPLVDSSGEGVPNLLRYALGIPPRAPGGNSLPSGCFQDGRAGIEFYRRLAATDLIYRAETSTNLVHWSTDPLLIEETSRNAEFARIRATSDLSTSATRFFRLTLEKTPAP